VLRIFARTFHCEFSNGWTLSVSNQNDQATGDRHELMVYRTAGLIRPVVLASAHGRPSHQIYNLRADDLGAVMETVSRFDPQATDAEVRSAFELLLGKRYPNWGVPVASSGPASVDSAA